MIFGTVAVTLLAAWLLSGVAERAGLQAYPGAHRQHQRPTPMVGGLAMFCGLAYFILLFDPQLKALLPSLLLLVFVGAMDDRFHLASGLRLLVQGVAAVLMIHFTGAELMSLGFLFSDQEVLLGRWSSALTVFATIGVINAINMSDGLDGLAGSLVLTILLIVWLIGGQSTSFLFATVLVISAFLSLNLRIGRPNARIFMGDAGSTMLGFLVAYVLIINTQGPYPVLAPTTTLWLVALPLMDAVAVMLIRPVRGQSPFAADRIHYHHLIQARGFGVNQTLCIVLAVQLLLSCIAITAQFSGVNQTTMFYIFMGLFVIYTLVLLLHTRDHDESVN